MIRVLYLSHNGMTEPLGRSQVIPYLQHLAERASIEIIAFEPPRTSPEDVARVRRLLAASDIRYTPLEREANPSLRTKVGEVTRLVSECARAVASRRPDIVHCRSYLPTAAGDVIAAAVPGARLLFDCRGMLGDEYVDARHWTRDDVRYRLVKRLEKRYFRRAEGVVVLSDALARWLRAHALVGDDTQLTVVPCCVDTARFRVERATRERERARLGIGDAPVIMYSGTLGSWYREDDMARFAAAAFRRDPRVRFHVLTRASTERLVRALAAHGFPESHLTVESVHPDAMPTRLAAGDIGVSFIEPCFSKVGSSPTKLAEYLATGLVAVANEGIGDVAQLASEQGTCVTIPSLSPERVEHAAHEALALIGAPWEDRASRAAEVARRRFGLAEVGAPRYLQLYEALTAAR